VRKPVFGHGTRAGMPNITLPRSAICVRVRDRDRARVRVRDRVWDRVRDRVRVRDRDRISVLKELSVVHL